MSQGKPIRGAPPVVKGDLDTGPREYSTIAEPMWALVRSVLQKYPHVAGAAHIPASILNSMGETHESMRAILREAERHETQSGKSTGAHADALLLARPQVEAVFIGLLLLHDVKKYLPWYQKAAWAARAQEVHYEFLRSGDTSAGKAAWDRSKTNLQQWAGDLGVTVEEHDATLAELTGAPPSAATKIRPLPMPGAVVQERLLANGQFESLADLLWRQWKFLCDPTHIGLPLIVRKSYLRGDPVKILGDHTRLDMLEEIHHHSVVPSLVSIITLATALVVADHRTDAKLVVTCAAAWDAVSKGTAIGHIVWEGWARQALGILK